MKAILLVFLDLELWVANNLAGSLRSPTLPRSSFWCYVPSTTRVGPHCPSDLLFWQCEPFRVSVGGGRAITRSLLVYSPFIDTREGARMVTGGGGVRFFVPAAITCSAERRSRVTGGGPCWLLHPARVYSVRQNLPI